MTKLTAISFITSVWVLLGLSGCTTINIGPSYDEALKEQTVLADEKADGKVLMIPINGTISDQPSEGFFRREPSVLDKVVMQLHKAEQDQSITSVLIKINSPGGSASTSDVLYHEIMAFKARTHKQVFVQMMDIAASGGYYLAMAGDHVQALPTTLTGSVGVISVMPEITGLTEKIGVEVHTFKSGASKDTGSPFRKFTGEDKQAIQAIVSQLAERFYQVVLTHRTLSQASIKEMKTARVYLADDALKAGLIDSVGYLNDGLKQACTLGNAKRCQVVTYRFNQNRNATVYSPNMQLSAPSPSLEVLPRGAITQALELNPGHYYLYLP